MKTIVNIVGFNAGWFACVLGAAEEKLWAGPVAVLALAAMNLSMTAPGERPLVLRLIVAACLLGFAVDSAMAASGLFAFVDSSLPNGLSRPWMVALWANFALTLRSSMSWLHGRYALGAVLGAVFGPLAYWAGARLGAISLDAWYSLPVLAAVWLATLPLMVWLSEQERMA